MAKRAARFDKDRKNREKRRQKRRALSYEGEPLEEYEEERSRQPMPKWLKRVLLILLACVLFLLIWFNRENLRPDRVISWVQEGLLGLSQGEGYPVSITGDQVASGNFQLMGQDVVAVSDTSISILNSSAKELANRQHSFGTPVLKVEGSTALLYNQGGKGLQIETRSKTLAKETLEENILAAAVSSSNLYAVATETQGYLSKLSVARQGSGGYETFYRYYFSEYYVTDLALNHDGTRAAAIGIAASGGAMQSAVYLFDFQAEQPHAQTEPDFVFEGATLYSVHFLVNGRLLVVGDQCASVINPATGEKTDFHYGGRTLVTYGFNAEDGAVLALSASGDGHSCQIVLLDNAGQTSEFATDVSAESVSRSNNMIAVLSNGVIYGYSTAGAPQGEWQVGADAKKILLSSPQFAYVLGISELRSADLT